MLTAFISGVTSIAVALGITVAIVDITTNVISTVSSAI
jgi:hypothetical protein